MVDVNTKVTDKLAHLKVEYTVQDSVEYQNAAEVYNNTIADIAVMDCYFCGGPGHVIGVCPMRLKLFLDWEFDPVRTMVFAKLCADRKAAAMGQQ